MLNLKIDAANAEPRDVAPASEEDGFQTPCTLHGVMAGLSGGSLGYVFGFGERRKDSAGLRGHPLHCGAGSAPGLARPGPVAGRACRPDGAPPLVCLQAATGCATAPRARGSCH